MDNYVTVDISARHIHLSVSDKDILFGEGYELALRPGTETMKQRPAVERVQIVGPKGQFNAVTILCPLRKETQFELSATDCRTLGISAPIRMSGNIAGSAGITVIGPKGQITLEEGAIIAKRHVHVSAAWAKERGLSNGDNIMIEVESDERSLIFKDVIVRIEKDPNQTAKMHIDTDEANAAGLKGIVTGTYAGKTVKIAQ